MCEGFLGVWPETALPGGFKREEEASRSVGVAPSAEEDLASLGFAGTSFGEASLESVVAVPDFAGNAGRLVEMAAVVGGLRAGGTDGLAEVGVGVGGLLVASRLELAPAVRVGLLAAADDLVELDVVVAVALAVVARVVLVLTFGAVTPVRALEDDRVVSAPVSAAVRLPAVVVDALGVEDDRKILLVGASFPLVCLPSVFFPHLPLGRFSRCVESVRRELGRLLSGDCCLLSVMAAAATSSRSFRLSASRNLFSSAAALSSPVSRSTCFCRVSLSDVSCCNELELASCWLPVSAVTSIHCATPGWLQYCSRAVSDSFNAAKSRSVSLISWTAFSSAAMTLGALTQ